MTVLQALPRNDDGHIVLKSAGRITRVDETTGEAEEIVLDVCTTEDAVVSLFGDLVHAEVPVSEQTYNALLAASSDAWREQWERWRSEGII